MSFKTFNHSGPKPLAIDPDAIANELVERLVASFSYEEQDTILFCIIKQVIQLRKMALEERSDLLQRTQRECEELDDHIQKLENLIGKQ